MMMGADMRSSLMLSLPCYKRSSPWFPGMPMSSKRLGRFGLDSRMLKLVRR